MGRLKICQYSLFWQTNHVETYRGLQRAKNRPCEFGWLVSYSTREGIAKKVVPLACVRSSRWPVIINSIYIFCVLYSFYITYLVHNRSPMFSTFLCRDPFNTLLLLHIMGQNLIAHNQFPTIWKSFPWSGFLIKSEIIYA